MFLTRLLLLMAAWPRTHIGVVGGISVTIDQIVKTDINLLKQHVRREEAADDNAHRLYTKQNTNREFFYLE